MVRAASIAGRKRFTVCSVQPYGYARSSPTPSSAARVKVGATWRVSATVPGTASSGSVRMRSPGSVDTPAKPDRCFTPKGSVRRRRSSASAAMPFVVTRARQTVTPGTFAARGQATLRSRPAGTVAVSRTSSPSAVGVRTTVASTARPVPFTTPAAAVRRSPTRR